MESSVNIQDDPLQRELSHTSDEKMKSIIATIQKEQNLAIRNEKAETLLIQGSRMLLPEAVASRGCSDSSIAAVGGKNWR